MKCSSIHWCRSIQRCWYIGRTRDRTVTCWYSCWRKEAFTYQVRMCRKRFWKDGNKTNGGLWEGKRNSLAFSCITFLPLAALYTTCGHYRSIIKSYLLKRIKNICPCKKLVYECSQQHYAPEPKSGNNPNNQLMNGSINCYLSIQGTIIGS